MKRMDSLIERKDYIKDQIGQIKTINDIDVIWQGIKIALEIRQGSFKLNEQLGSNFNNIDCRSSEQFKLEFNKVIRCVLRNFNEISIHKVEYTFKDDGMVFVSIYALYNAKVEILELNFKTNILKDGLKWKD